MARFVNLVYALLVEGQDEDARAEIDGQLDQPTEWELAQARKYLTSTEVPKAPVTPPSWWGDDSVDELWAAEAGTQVRG